MNEPARLIAQLSQPLPVDDEAAASAAEATAITLGQLGDVALPAIEALLQPAAVTTAVDTRFWLVRSLWANGSQAAISLLIDCLADEDDLVRSGAAIALGELKTTGAIAALGRLMRDDQTTAGDHAADALSKIGQPVAQVLITALTDECSTVRLRAAKALIPLESHAAIKPLINCLDHDSSYLVRHYADLALKRMGVGEMIYFKP